MAIYSTSEKTRQALVNAAGELAAELGFASVSTRAIATRAGENIGSIHYHFGGKQKLFEAVVAAVTVRWQNEPLDQVLADCDLTSRAGQAQAVALTLRRMARLLFDRTAPDWHCRVIYQLLQLPNPLQEAFREGVFEPDSRLIEKLLKRIAPGLSDKQVQIHFFVLMSPLILHADYQKALFRRMDITEYDEEYLHDLIDVCIRQALLLYGLPVE